MILKSLQKPEDMTPECLNNCRACYEIQDLYWERKKITDPEKLAEIDRQFIDFLLKFDGLIEFDGQKVGILDHLKFNEWELAKLRHRREITDDMRDRLRIFCDSFTRDTVGT